MSIGIGIDQRLTNDYNLLSPGQIEEVVELEDVAETVMDLGSKLNFKFDSIKKGSDDILNLLVETLTRY